MEETTASNVLSFKQRDVNKGYRSSGTLSPKEVHTLSLLIRQVAGELKTEEAEIFEITQRVFGICDLSHIPARDLDAVMAFLAKLPLLSKATVNP
jgi:hypothetical protein